MQTLKSLFVTLVVLGGAFLAYDYFLAPRQDKIVFKNWPSRPAPPVPQATPPPAAVEKPLTVSEAAAAKAPMPSAPITTAPVSPAPPGPLPEPPQVAPVFVPPPIPDVAQATQQWTRIPSTAFPRPAKLTAPAAFKGQFGSVQLAAGTDVIVLGAQNGVLTVTPNAKSPMRSNVPINSTNLKATLTATYNSWRAQRIEAARAAFMLRTGEPPPPVQIALHVTGSGQPKQADDGTYPLLLASMRAGQVTEITPRSIKKWGQAHEGKFNGEPCWDVNVEFDAQTAFGKLSSEAFAKVKGGKVMGWFYRSGEPVP